MISNILKKLAKNIYKILLLCDIYFHVYNMDKTRWMTIKINLIYKGYQYEKDLLK